MKLFIGTPVLSNVKIDYHISMIETVVGLELSQIDYHIDHVIGCSIIDDARNQLVEKFITSDCTHLLFIDSDISWSTEAIRLLLNNADLPIVGGLYPKKKISNYPILSSNEIGTLDSSIFYPQELLKTNTKEPIKVKHLPTGFMMISREVFNKFRKEFTNRTYFEEGVEKFLYFSCELVDNKHYGEDINFCRMAGILGYQCYAIPAIELSHVGDIHYRNVLK